MPSEKETTDLPVGSSKSGAKTDATKGRSSSTSTSFPPARWIFTALLGASLLLFLRPRTNHYTLCSRKRNIYTVDDANPRVECISVRGSLVVDTGGFRKSKASGMACRSSDVFICSEEIEKRQTILPQLADALPQWISSNVGLKPRVIQVADGSVVVPGLTGGYSFMSRQVYPGILPPN